MATFSRTSWPMNDNMALATWRTQCRIEDQRRAQEPFDVRRRHKAEIDRLLLQSLRPLPGESPRYARSWGETMSWSSTFLPPGSTLHAGAKAPPPQARRQPFAPATSMVDLGTCRSIGQLHPIRERRVPFQPPAPA